MSILYITEYAELARDANGHIVQAGINIVTTQKVTFTATHGESAAFNNLTKFIRIFADGAGFLAFGTSPVAVTATGTPIAASTAEYFGVRGGDKVSAVS